MTAPVPDTTALCLRAKIEEVFEFTTGQCIELLTLAQAARRLAAARGLPARCMPARHL